MRFSVSLAALLLLVPLAAHAGVGNPPGSNLPSYSAASYGVVCNGKNIANVTTTAGSAVVSSSAYVFTSADVGKSISIYGGGALTETGNITSGSTALSNLSASTPVYIGEPVAGTGIPSGTTVAGVTSWTGGNYAVKLSQAATATTTGVSVTFAPPFNATINSVSAGNATLSANAGTSIAGTGAATFGTPTATALVALVNSVNSAGGGKILLPKGICVIDSPLYWQSNVSMSGECAGKSILKWLSTSDQTVGVINGSGTSGAPYYDNQFSNFEIDGSSATQATYNVSGKGFQLPYTVRSLIENVYVHDMPATCIATDFAQSTTISKNYLYRCGRLGSGNIGSSGIGEGISSNDAQESYMLTNNTIIDPTNFGIFTENQTGTTATNVSEVIADNVIIQTLVTTGAGGGTIMPGGIGSNSIGGVISGNKITCKNNSNLYHGISIDSSTSGQVTGVETVITGNSVMGCEKQINIDFNNGPGPSTLPEKFVISGNRLVGSGASADTTQDGIYVKAYASNAFNGLSIAGNMISLNGRCGVLLSSGAGFKNVNISANMIFDNSSTNTTDVFKSGVCFNVGVTGLTMVGNTIYDDGTATQKYGIANNTGVTLSGALISANNLSGNTGSALNNLGTIAGSVTGNAGYNPVGASSVTPGASPWTYTAGITPETLHLYGGTVSGVAKGGVTLATTSPTVVTLLPGESVVVTYTAAPTAVTSKE